MGLDVYLYPGPHVDREDDDACDTRIEIPSTRYPEHLFKIGYFRSSYNGGGVNRVLKRYGVPTLDAIMAADLTYAFVPDWPDVLARTDAALSDYDAARERMRWDVFSESPTLLGENEPAVHDDRAALDVFLGEMGKPRPFDTEWASRAGLFLPNGRSMHGLVRGIDAIGKPCLYVITERDADSIAWYRQALEIVRETAEWVLAQPDPKAFHVHWSS